MHNPSAFTSANSAAVDSIINIKSDECNIQQINTNSRRNSSAGIYHHHGEEEVEDEELTAVEQRTEDTQGADDSVYQSKPGENNCQFGNSGSNDTSNGNSENNNNSHHRGSSKKKREAITV